MDKKTFIRELDEEGSIKYSFELNNMNNLYGFEIAYFNQLSKIFPEVFYSEHNHSFYSVLWILAGEGFHIVESEKYEIKPGRLFFLPPNKIHEFYNCKNLKGIEFMFTDSIFGSSDKSCDKVCLM